MRRTLSLLITLTILLIPTVCTADYLFSVDRYHVDVYVANDGNASIIIDYDITFRCEPGGRPIDIVDIGLPNKHYNPRGFSATLNGHKLSGITQSAYVKIGIEIPLGRHTIKPGKTGRLKVRGKVGKMVRRDSTDANYTSVKFAPTYWGSQYTRGTVDVHVRMHFPKGVTTNETKWHRPEPDKRQSIGGHMVFTWIYKGVSPGSKLTKRVSGIGFPKSYVKNTYHESFLTKLGRFIVAAIKVLIVPWIFPFGFFIGFAIIAVRRKKRRMMKYMPPQLSVEGVGIKRGLTAPQAALLLEMPLDKVLIMVLFGLLKKGAVNIKSTDPFLMKKQDTAGFKIRPYENQFLDCIRKNGAFSQTKGQKFIAKFIKSLNKKMRGFSRKETVRYYKRIAESAWEMVQAAGTPEKVGEAFSDRGDWMLMEEEFGDKMQRTCRHDTVIWPRWWGHHTTHSGPPVSGGPTTSLPDFAHSVTQSISNFANGLVSDISAFTSKITSKTNPPPVSSGGGCAGGGCACACACAGCACACAGGGR